MPRPHFVLRFALALHYSNFMWMRSILCHSLALLAFLHLNAQQRANPDLRGGIQTLDIAPGMVRTSGRLFATDPAVTINTQLFTLRIAA